MSKLEVVQTIEYLQWFEKQSLKTQSVISKRIKNMILEGHFGDFKNVSRYDKGISRDCVFELRWDDGKRIYYGKVGPVYLLLLCGGNKNGQNKDIEEAKNIFIKHVESKDTIENQKKRKSKEI